jgi:hypothetical protein
MERVSKHMLDVYVRDILCVVNICAGVMSM